MEKVLCLAVGQTYDIVKDTYITAHPAVAPYPNTETKYVAPIKSGGIVESIYEVNNIIDCYPITEEIKKIGNANLILYHKLRLNDFGYSNDKSKYRFYILDKPVILKQPYICKGIRIAKIIDYDQLIPGFK